MWKSVRLKFLFILKCSVTFLSPGRQKMPKKHNHHFWAVQIYLFLPWSDQFIYRMCKVPNSRFCPELQARKTKIRGIAEVSLTGRILRSGSLTQTCRAPSCTVVSPCWCAFHHCFHYLKLHATDTWNMLQQFQLSLILGLTFHTKLRWNCLFKMLAINIFENFLYSGLMISWDSWVVYWACTWGPPSSPSWRSSSSLSLLSGSCLSMYFTKMMIKETEVAPFLFWTKGHCTTSSSQPLKCTVVFVCMRWTKEAKVQQVPAQSGHSAPHPSHSSPPPKLLQPQSTSILTEG